ncbi:MAG: PadR family transcriptional regulator [Clostridiales bacterium]|jgi:PadR family transcriptional regulator PadR|nr:PadR family transcriptional regulator [Clostridiales bacterium]
MDSIHSEFFRSNVTAVILRSLYEEDRYGYDILREIARKSQGGYSIKQATLYGCLKRLAKNGFIKAFWGEASGGGRRRYYSLTEKGRDFLDKNKLEYEYSRALLDKLLYGADAERTFGANVTEQATEREYDGFDKDDLGAEADVAYAENAPSDGKIYKTNGGGVYAEKAYPKTRENAKENGARNSDAGPQNSAYYSNVANSNPYNLSRNSEAASVADSDFDEHNSATSSAADSIADYSPPRTVVTEKAKPIQTSIFDNAVADVLKSESARSFAVYELPEDFGKSSGKDGSVYERPLDTAETNAVSRNDSVYRTPDGGLEKTATESAAESADTRRGLSEKNKSDGADGSLRSYRASAAQFYDAETFGFGEQRRLSEIQREEYYRDYRNTLARKENDANKLYDNIFAPSIPYSSVVKDPAEPIRIPDEPVRDADKNAPDFLAAYTPAAGSSGDSENENKERAAEILGIGKYQTVNSSDKLADAGAERAASAQRNDAQPPAAYNAGNLPLDKSPERIPERAAPVQRNDAQPPATYSAERASAINILFKDGGIPQKSADRIRTFDGADFLDDSGLKFQRFEKYDADGDRNGVNYKNVFNEEILVKRADGEESTEQPPADGGENAADNRPANFNDVKNKLTNEGYEIRSYNKANTSEFFAKNYIFNRKINAHTYISAWGVWLAELVVAGLAFNNLFQFTVPAFLALLFIPSAVPLFFLALYAAKPNNRVKDNFDLKRALKSGAIAAAALLILTAVIAFSFLNAANADNPTWPATILTPAIFLSNIPLSAVIYDAYRKTKKYNLR